MTNVMVARDVKSSLTTITEGAAGLAGDRCRIPGQFHGWGFDSFTFLGGPEQRPKRH